MNRIFADMSVSLDGYIAGPNDCIDNPLGDGGQELHGWVYGLRSWREPQGLDGGETGPEDEIIRESSANVGATILGRRMFSNENGPWGEHPFRGHWGDEPPFHGPVFVLTHHPRDPLPMQGGTTFHFVTDGIESALEQARQAANGQDIRIAGGADVVQQYLAAGLLDEIQLHVVPILLGGGIRLLDGVTAPDLRIEQDRVIASPAVTHIRYRVGRTTPSEAQANTRA